MDDRLDVLPGLDGRTGTTSAMAMRLTGIAASATDSPSRSMPPSLELQVGDRGNDRSLTCVHDARVPRVRPRSCPGSDGAPPVVAATKLTIPRSRRPLVPRPGLSARLDEDYRLALVSAPAGYGKTAALAMWAAEHRDRVAWLSCDPSDAEPTRFMSGLLAAIAATVAGCGRRRLRAAGARRRQHLRRGGRGGERARHDRRTGCDRGGRPSSGGARSGVADRVHRGVARRLPLRRRVPGPIRRCRWPGCVCAATCSSCVATISASLQARCPSSSRCTTSA